MMHDVVITGIGLVTSLGEGLDAHRALISALPQPVTKILGGAVIHPAPSLNFDTQIPKKGDQRQMEPWQRLGVHTAGLALEDARIKGDDALLQKTHMIVAAGGGERDEATDEAVLNGIETAADAGAYLNAQLGTNLRPTLFLAQLTNLLAGNISIVHGVTGSSRSFMGEEAAGMEALRTLHARIASGQAEIGLVGAAYNAERRDMLVNYNFADAVLKSYQPIAARQAHNEGIAFGSMGAFLVLEQRQHALDRKANIHATLQSVATLRTSRRAGDVTHSLQQLTADISDEASAHVLSCACGAGDATREELSFWNEKGAAMRAIGTMFGHAPEAQPILATALAALSLGTGVFFSPFEHQEKAAASGFESIAVSCCGHWRGEGLMTLMREGN